MFFVLHHARRSVLHVRVTEHPTAGWITQQLREAFPYDAVPRYLIFDNDKKYGDGVLAVIANMGIRRKQITPHSPWQNGLAERWVETVRRSTSVTWSGYSPSSWPTTTTIGRTSVSPRARQR